MDDDKIFKLERVSGAPVSREDLLADLIRVAGIVGQVVSQRAYAEYGTFDPSTFCRRFGSWNNAIKAAGLSPANVCNYPDSALFENIMCLWEHYGRQPRRLELSSLPSTISQGPYKRRFKSWINALQQFVTYANSDDIPVPIANGEETVRKSSRDPSLRVRFMVLKRDNFRCCACGSSPATSPGLHLHVDHIVPWSAGGLTQEGNLQTLCERCNLGKSNVL